MTPFEKTNFDAAARAFKDAFESAYAAAIADLEGGRAQRVPEVYDGFDVEVPRDAIFGGEWRRYIALFEAAGRRAALASTRVGAPVLVRPELKRDGQAAEALHWWVWLDFDRSWDEPWECGEVPF